MDYPEYSEEFYEYTECYEINLGELGDIDDEEIGELISDIIGSMYNAGLPTPMVAQNGSNIVVIPAEYTEYFDNYEDFLSMAIDAALIAKGLKPVGM